MKKSPQGALIYFEPLPISGIGAAHPSSSAKVYECHLFGGIFILWHDRQAYTGLIGIDMK